jgi:phosphatidylserine/phosphatidylglycerophosphate/cardiolipin synthase-like enzyme
MLSRLLRRINDKGLATSQLFNEQSFYGQFRQDLERAKNGIVIESPFMTRRRVKLLLPSLHRAVQRGVKVTVNTRELNEHEGRLYAEAIWAAAALQAGGIEVLFTSGHHRKLAILDKKILWEGSHNILSQNDSSEIMRRIDSPALAQQMIDFIGIGRFL